MINFTSLYTNTHIYRHILICPWNTRSSKSIRILTPLENPCVHTKLNWIVDKGFSHKFSRSFSMSCACSSRLAIFSCHDLFESLRLCLTFVTIFLVSTPCCNNSRHLFHLFTKVLWWIIIDYSGHWIGFHSDTVRYDHIYIHTDNTSTHTFTYLYIYLFIYVWM